MDDRPGNAPRKTILDMITPPQTPPDIEPLDGKGGRGRKKHKRRKKTTQADKTQEDTFTTETMEEEFMRTAAEDEVLSPDLELKRELAARPPYKKVAFEFNYEPVSLDQHSL